MSELNDQSMYTTLVKKARDRISRLLQQLGDEHRAQMIFIYLLYHSQHVDSVPLKHSNYTSGCLRQTLSNLVVIQFLGKIIKCETFYENKSAPQTSPLMFLAMTGLLE